jgi:hypothetical protein
MNARRPRRRGAWLALALVTQPALLSAEPQRSPNAASPPVSPPPAEDPAARAQALRDQGNQAMLDMRYVDALSLYDQAEQLNPADVGILYSVARAHQLLGEYPEALTSLEEFERRASPEMKAKVGRLEQLFVELKSRVATLDLHCNQPGARVLLRDKVIGTTPLKSLRLPAGGATLQLELEGFFPEKRDVVLPAGGTLSLDLALHARSRSALLLVGTQPSGARVLVDGRNIGTSSPRAELVLASGSHHVTAQREGYDEASVPVVLTPGSTRELTVSLERTVPLTSRWWFWTGAALLVAGGAAASYALLSERPADHGSLPPGQVSAPLQAHF